MATVPVDRFADAVKDILDEYADNVRENLVEITDKVGKEGAKTLRQNAHANVGGNKYYKQWASITEQPTRVTVTATIHNKKKYQLTHLLEDGHETYNQYGGPYRRTPAHPHIDEVEKVVVEQYETEVVSKL